MDIKTYIQTLGQRAKTASQALARASTSQKNSALQAIADHIRRELIPLKAANAKDIARARQNHLDEASIDRLTLSDRAISTMLDGLEQIIALPDPIGEITQLKYRPTGIQVGQMRVPLGVIGIIYESRPNVTIDAAALCLKSGNAAILRGGSESIESNKLLADLIRQALQHSGLPEDTIQIVETTDREAVGEMIRLQEFIDVIVPRGGKALIARLSQEAKVPMIKHLDGICHVYIDDFADIDKALRISDNAKTHRYGTCNTMETLLLGPAIAPRILPALAKIYEEKQVELRCCSTSHTLLSSLGIQGLAHATEEDWSTEYLAPILSIKIVEDLDNAISHINTYGSAHTDAIVTENYSHAMRFLREVDSASVMVNASTRFADGFEYGLGAEIGISNDKLHARGPVGLEGLTSVKYVVLGSGQVRT